MKKALCKVCHITFHHPLDSRIFYKECQTLAKSGFDVVLLVPFTGDEIVEGVKIVGLPIYRTRFKKFLFLPLVAFYYAFKQQAIIYHFHDPIFLITGFLLKLTGKKVVYDVHEDFPKRVLDRYWIPLRLRILTSVIISLIEKLSCIFLDAIVAASPAIYQRFKHHKRAIMLRNLPVLSLFDEELLSEKRREEKAIKAIYVGGLSPDRGITQIVRALEYLKSGNVKLILCGNFSPAGFEKEIKNLPGFKRVEYMGFLEHKEITKILAEADLGLVTLLPTPQHQESLPIKLFEYMAAGLPVVASNFPLWKEIIEGENCGICVNPSNPEEIASAIEYLMDNPEEARKMAENGRRAVLEKYNWEIESKKLLTLYKELIAAK